MFFRQWLLGRAAARLSSQRHCACRRYRPTFQTLEDRRLLAMLPLASAAEEVETADNAQGPAIGGPSLVTPKEVDAPVVVRANAATVTQDADFPGFTDPIYFLDQGDLKLAPEGASPVVVDTDVTDFAGAGYFKGVDLYVFDTLERATRLYQNVQLLNGHKFLANGALYDVLAPDHGVLMADEVSALRRLHFFKGERLFAMTGPNSVAEVTAGVTKLMPGERLFLKGEALWARVAEANAVVVDTGVTQVEGNYYLKGNALFFVNAANSGEEVSTGVTRLLPGGRFFMTGSRLWATSGAAGTQVDEGVTRIIGDGRHYLKGTALYSVAASNQPVLALEGATAVSFDGLKIARGAELFAKSQLEDVAEKIFTDPAGAAIDLDFGGEYFVAGGALHHFTGSKSFVAIASGVSQVCHDGRTFLKDGHLYRVGADHSAEDLGAATMCLDHPVGALMTEVRAVTTHTATIAWENPRQEPLGQHFIAVKEGPVPPENCDAETLFNTPMVSEFDSGLATISGLQPNTQYSARHCVAIERAALSGDRYIAAEAVFKGDVRSFGEDLGVMIPDSSSIGARYEIEVAQSGVLEDLYLRFKINHSFIGDLVVTLIGPEGQKVLLHDRGGGG